MSFEEGKFENIDLKNATAGTEPPPTSSCNTNDIVDENEGFGDGFGNDDSMEDLSDVRIHSQDYDETNPFNDTGLDERTSQAMRLAPATIQNRQNQQPIMDISADTDAGEASTTPSRKPYVSASTPSSTTTTTTTASTSSPNLLNSLIATDGGNNYLDSNSSPGATASVASRDEQQYAMQQEMEGIKLLRQIFPGESPHELRKLYNEHVMQKANAANAASPPIAATEEIASPPSIAYKMDRNDDTIISTIQPKSKLGKRLWKQARELDRLQRQQQRQLDGESSGAAADESNHRPLEWQEVTLPTDFLRLPPQVAVRRHCQEPISPLGSSWRYQLVDELEQRALRQHGVTQYPFPRQADSGFSSSPGASAKPSSIKAPAYYTVVIYRDSKVGLGVTLREDGSDLRVHALAQIRSNAASQLTDNEGDDKDDTGIDAWNKPTNLHNAFGPAFRAGVRAGDILFGINGTAFRQSKSPSDSLLRHAVNSIRQSPDPIVLHLERQSHLKTVPGRPVSVDTVDAASPIRRTTANATSKSNQSGSAPPWRTTQASLLDEDEVETEHVSTLSQESRRKSLQVSDVDNHKMSPTRSKRSLAPPPAIHPFATALANRRLILSKQDEITITRTLERFTERTRQWESTSSFRIHAKTFALQPHWDPKDLPPDMAAILFPFDAYPHVKPERSYAPSTPTLEPTSPLIPREYIEAFYGMDEEDMANFDVEEDDGGSAANPLMLFRRKQRQQQNSSTKGFLSFPGAKARPAQQADIDAVPDIFIPLMGVRKALCTRIVNTFIEETRIAYTIWVYDVESGREWYAPIRYSRDFCDLRDATLPLCPEAIGLLPFPKTGGSWSNVFGGALVSRDESNEPDRVRQAKCSQLENFLRALCAMIYCHELHPQVAEVAIHVQSFLGCETGLAGTPPGIGKSSNEEEDWGYTPTNQSQGASRKSSTKRFRRKRRYCGEDEIPGHDDYQVSVRLLLKRSLQRYTHRLFLLGTMKAIVDQFTDATRARAPQLRELESMETEGRAALKTRAMTDMERIQAFLDQMLDLIIEGCMGDFESIAARKDFHPIFEFYQPIVESLEGSFDSNADDEKRPVRNSAQLAYWDRLTREAVREQIEIEVYVPLRSVVSRLLVNGWRHEDMEVHFKMEELRKRPQGLFRIPTEKFSPSNWQSVATILKKGVDMNTLPCAKLRAIVEAAREISRLYQEEQSERQLQLRQSQQHDAPRVDEDSEEDSKGSHGSATRQPSGAAEGGGDSTQEHLSADDFLPIFIFCVVQAQMERPCALCVLLRTLCDRINRNGEIGYFLASFEAAITHIQEIDLTEDREEMLSFLTVPLTDNSLNESMVT